MGCGQTWIWWVLHMNLPSLNLTLHDPCNGSLLLWFKLRGQVRTLNPGVEISWLVLRKRLLCISISFWVLQAPKSWSKHFFQPFFTLFCSFHTFFTPEISKKHLKMNKKKRGFVYSSKLTCKSWSTPWGVPQNCLFSVDFLFNGQLCAVQEAVCSAGCCVFRSARCWLVKIRRR